MERGTFEPPPFNYRFIWKAPFPSSSDEPLNKGDKYVSNYSDMPELRPTYDPHEGFERKRKIRKMIATEDEMDAARLLPSQRDYCAHKFIPLKECMGKSGYFKFLCEPQVHEYVHCINDDYVLRMKEFEREKRLHERKKSQN